MYYRIFLILVLFTSLPAKPEMVFTTFPRKLDQSERMAIALSEKLMDYDKQYNDYLKNNRSGDEDAWHQSHRKDLEEMIEFLKKGPEFNILDDYAVYCLARFTVFFLCKPQPLYEEFIQQVIHNGALYNERIRQSILEKADACGIKKLIQHGLRLSNDDDEIIVHVAAHNSDPEVLELLLSVGGNPNAATPEWWSALMIAAQDNNLGAVKALVNRIDKIDEKVHSYKGRTPLHFSFFTILEKLNRDYLRDKHTIIGLLINKGCEINALDDKGNTPFMCAIKKHDSYDVEPDQKLIDLVVAHGADPLLKDRNGLSVLHYASHKGLHKIIKALLVAMAKYQPAKIAEAQKHAHFDVNQIFEKNAFYEEVKQRLYKVLDFSRTIAALGGVAYCVRMLNKKYKIVGIFS